MRALSIFIRGNPHLLVLLRADSGVERRYRRDRRDFCSASTARRGTVRQHTLHQNFSPCSFSASRVSVPKGSRRRRSHGAGSSRRSRPASYSSFSNWWLLDLPLPLSAVTGFYILTLSAGYICLLMGGRVDEPAVEERHDGRSFQQRETNRFMQETRPCRERILGETYRRGFYYNKRWHNGFANVRSAAESLYLRRRSGVGQELRRRQSIHQAADRKGVHDVRLRLQVSRPRGRSPTTTC